MFELENRLQNWILREVKLKYMYLFIYIRKPRVVMMPLMITFVTYDIFVKLWLLWTRVEKHCVESYPNK